MILTYFFPSCEGVTGARSDSDIGRAAPFILSAMLTSPPAPVPHQYERYHSTEHQKCLMSLRKQCQPCGLAAGVSGTPRSTQATP